MLQLLLLLQTLVQIFRLHLLLQSRVLPRCRQRRRRLKLRHRVSVDRLRILQWRAVEGQAGSEAPNRLTLAARPADKRWSPVIHAAQQTSQFLTGSIGYKGIVHLEQTIYLLQSTVGWCRGSASSCVDRSSGSDVQSQADSHLRAPGVGTGGFGGLAGCWCSCCCRSCCGCAVGRPARGDLPAAVTSLADAAVRAGCGAAKTELSWGCPNAAATAVGLRA